MKKIFMIKTIGMAAIGLAFALNAMADKRPNIIWIFSDDHSFQTIGAYGGRLQHLNPTPNLDKLAKEGMIFQRAYVGNSICAPSRNSNSTRSAPVTPLRGTRSSPSWFRSPTMPRSASSKP